MNYGSGINARVSDAERAGVARVMQQLGASKTECSRCEQIIWTLARRSKTPRRFNLDGHKHTCPPQSLP
jgi:hypothetical protein